MTLPGSRSLAFASRWFDPATVHRTFEPLIADWQREWIDAPRSRRWLVHLKGIVTFGIAAIVSMPAIVRTRAPKSLTDRVARRIAIATGLGTAVFMLPFIGEIEPWERQVLILFVIPQAMTLAFPFAMVSAVDAIRNFAGVESHVARGTAAKLAAIAVLFMLVMHGWVVPAAGQKWREGTFHPSSQPPRGVRELTTSDLLTDPALLATHEPRTNEFYRANSIRRELNNRAALAVLPVLLVWRRWRALDLPRGRWFSAQPAAIGTIAMTFAFFASQIAPQIVEMKWQLPVGSSYWISLGLLALLGTIRVNLAERSLARA